MAGYCENGNKIWGCIKEEYFLTSWGTVSFSRTALCEVSLD